jgi:hypothetical protein
MGEFLILITFNYNTVTDLISSNFFMSTKNHVIFFLKNTNTELGDTIFLYILFFTTCALLFLLNLRYSFNYEFFEHEYDLD